MTTTPSGYGAERPANHLRRKRLLTLLYQRMGNRYPTWFLVVELQGGFLIAAGAVALLDFYVEMSPGQLAGFLTLALGLTAVAIGVSIVRGHRLLSPVRQWIAGRRDPEFSQEAWRAAMRLPLQTWARQWHWQALLGLALPLTAGALLMLDVTPVGAIGVFLGACVILAYAGVLHYLSLESGMQPVLTHIARTLPSHFEPGRVAVPLKWKLLTSLPLISVITAMVVAGLVSSKDSIRAISLDVLVATSVAFTISLVLTLRLSNSLLRSVDELVEATVRVERGDFGAHVPITTPDELGELAKVFNRMVAGLAERERIREVFGTYLDRDVAERILEGGASLEGEKVDVTVLFLDIRDFTGLVERSDAREVVATLNRLFGLAVPIIASHFGHVDKFIGDGLLAVFGAPTRRQDHADQALEAALEINGRMRESFGDELEVGIGINSGVVVAGNLGGGGRLNFSVIGDAVNLAARVEAATRQTGDRILISEDTLSQLQRSDVRLVERPAVALKGKRRPVALYTPVAD